MAKILEINKFNYLRRGAEKHFLDVVTLLKSKGHEVAVFSMDHPENLFSPWKKYFVSYAGFGAEDAFYSKLKGLLRLYSFESKRKIAKLLDDFQPDVVHIHNIYHHISPSILGEIKKRKIPVVMTIHDYNLICPDYSLLCRDKEWDDIKGNKYVYFIKNKCFKNSHIQSFLAVAEFLFNKKYGFYKKYVDLYISPSKFAREKLVRGGIPAEKISVIPHFFIEENTVDTLRDKAVKEKYVFHFGSLSKEKGVDKLIKIFQELPEVTLYLAGRIEGDLKIPEAENIKYLGFLNLEKMESCIENSLFVISLSRLPETFGLIALEALAKGKPFIGYAGGSFAEIVENEKTGYLCQNEEEIAEKIKKLASDNELRAQFSRNALKRAKDFESSRYYAKIMEIFRSF